MMLTKKSTSTSQLMDLPNLPGVKKDLSEINPKLYKEFKAATVPLDESFLQASISKVEEPSLDEYIQDPSKYDLLQKSLNPYPTCGVAFNDVYGGRYSLTAQKRDVLTKSRSLPYCSLDSAPSFVRNADMACRFLAYFDEKTIDNGREMTRARTVEIVFHAEDNTLEITEQKIRNSGIVQGKILKRHQVCKPNDRGEIVAGVIFTLSDFYAGAVLNIYSRSYVVVDCDRSTREYMEDLEIPFGESQPLPRHVYTHQSLRPPTNPNAKSITKKSEPPSVKGAGFYMYDKQTLRFYGVYDDTHSLYGDKIMVRLHYFLADNKMEVVADTSRNSGRDGLALPRLSKNSIPKSDDKFAITNANNTILQDGDPVEMYHWRDLFIGEYIQTASIRIRILDADRFTREFYEKAGIPLADKIVLPKIESKSYSMEEIMAKSQAQSDVKVEKGTGMNSVGAASGEKKDGQKATLNAGIILRFVARMDKPKREDVHRVFIIQMYLEDDNIQIMEPPVRNSGFKGGVFLTKTPVESSVGGRKVQATDLFIGAEIQLLSHKFIIFDADEFTLKYMEHRAYMWEVCDVPKIKAKLKSKAPVLRRRLLLDRDLPTKLVAPAELEALLMDPVLALGLVKQEVVTLFRSIRIDLGHKDDHTANIIPLTNILSIVQ